MPPTPRRKRRSAVKKARPQRVPPRSAMAHQRLDTYYAAHVVDGRAELPRIHERQQTHWLVRVTDRAGQHTTYAQCFADALPILLHPPETLVGQTEDALRTMEHGTRRGRPSRRNSSLSVEQWLAERRAEPLSFNRHHNVLDTTHDTAYTAVQTEEPKTR